MKLNEKQFTLASELININLLELIYFVDENFVGDYGLEMGRDENTRDEWENKRREEH